jgi:hypothetical protein
LAHTFLWGCSYKRLKLAQLLSNLGVFLTVVVEQVPQVWRGRARGQRKMWAAIAMDVAAILTPPCIFY